VIAAVPARRSDAVGSYRFGVVPDGVVVGGELFEQPVVAVALEMQ
jgi:hypothetical protein